ncbi:MAG: hypothetical protein AAFQ81_04520 [Pseudomonadota bacterium]
MIKEALAALSIALVTVFALPATAQQGPRTLAGTWVISENIGLSWNGVAQTMESLTHAEMEIVEHSGKIFSGTVRWGLTSDEHQLDDGNGVAQVFEEELIAIEDFDGTILMVEHPDTTMRRIRFLGDDTIEILAYETGPGAIVSRSTWVRE